VAYIIKVSRANPKPETTHHRSSRDRVGGGGAALPGGDDRDTRSPDVDNGTIVGEGSLGIVDIRGSDGDGRGGASWRSVGSVDIGVTSGNDDVDTTGSQLLFTLVAYSCRYSRKHTLATALSIAVAALPPRDMETIEGRPEALAWVKTQLRPEMLFNQLSKR